MTTPPRQSARVRLVAVLLALVIASTPGKAVAGVGLSLKLLSFGDVSLSAGIPLRVGTAGAVAMFLISAISYFVEASEPSTYSRSYNGPGPRTVETLVIKVRPEDRVSGDELRASLSSTIESSRIPLSHGGYLRLDDDGRMIFRDTTFAGYAEKHHDGSLWVWTADEQLVAMVIPRRGGALLRVEKSGRSTQALRALGVDVTHLR